MAAALWLAVGGCGPAVSAAHQDAARQLTRENASVDLHSHPGMLPSSPLPMAAQAERMTRGQVRVALVATVADGPLIGRRPHGGLYATREPGAGELYAYTWRQVARVRAQVAAGSLVLVQSPAELAAPGGPDRPRALLAVEGGDFLEGRLERVEEAHGRGVRAIQLVHYRVNELGDIQTEPPRHGGLTRFGQDVIREMNRVGMVVDVAHLTHDGVKTAAAVSRKPMILSHTIVDTPWARAVSSEHARLVARGGGVVGVFPVNMGYVGFRGYVEHIMRMIGAAGVDHVGIGTDMDGISPASFVSFDDYREWPSLGAALLARGLSPADVAKVMGGNFRRVFAEVAGS